VCCCCADYTNLGCYALRPNRLPLPQLLLDSPTMTPGFCYKKATSYKFFALFNGTRCYAGTDLAPSLRKGRGSQSCTTPCGSGSKHTCGGPAAFMVYVNHAAQVVPAAVVPLGVGPAAEAPQPLLAANTSRRESNQVCLGVLGQVQGGSTTPWVWGSPHTHHPH
jgi:hypothetical protein